MKLRNKKTGEILEVLTDSIAVKVLRDGEDITGYYNSLAELNKEWEDAPEEPKEYWYIYGNQILKNECDGVLEDGFKEIGNYFETKEEAEKAVEKLKAWKRLKDKGFRFTGYDKNYGHHRASFIFKKEAWATETEPDLELLFGGEE